MPASDAGQLGRLTPASLVGGAEPDDLGGDAQPSQGLGPLGGPPDSQLVGGDARRPGVRGLAVGDGDDHDVAPRAVAHQPAGREHLVVGMRGDDDEPTHAVHQSSSPVGSIVAASVPWCSWPRYTVRSAIGPPVTGVEAQRRRALDDDRGVEDHPGRLGDADAHERGPATGRRVVGGVAVDLAPGGGEEAARAGQRRGDPAGGGAGERIIASGGVVGEVAADPRRQPVPAGGDADAAVPEPGPGDVRAGWPDLIARRHLDVEAPGARVAGPHPDRVPVVGEPQGRDVDVEQPHHPVRIGGRQQRPVEAVGARAPRLRAGEVPAVRCRSSDQQLGAGRPHPAQAVVTRRRRQLGHDRDRVEVALGEPSQRAVGGGDRREDPQAVAGAPVARVRDVGQRSGVGAEPGQPRCRIIVVEGDIGDQHGCSLPRPDPPPADFPSYG